jgi:hypothetical protein
MRTQQQPDTRLTYSLDEASAQTGLSVSFLRLEAARGRLHLTHAGRRVLVTSKELSRYLEPIPALQDRHTR